MIVIFMQFEFGV